MSKLGFVKNKWFLFAGGLVLGALIILAIRFVTYKPDQVHYHANFAVYINGQREEFKSPTYYQEVAVCSTVNGITQPVQRAHMHDEINSVIHVHDHAVTWGQFFENIGWYLGPNFIENADNKMYIENGSDKLNIVLNGQNITDFGPMDNVVIKDQDRMLISYGDISDSTLATEYKSVPATAHHYDITKDPASCAGTEKVTPADRLKHLF
jgi:hypothetical protein